MGITISIEEIGFLKNFGGQKVEQQDQILVQNGMNPIPADKVFREHLNINGAYIGLIRGICEMAIRKKDMLVEGLEQDNKKLTEEVLELKDRISKLRSLITNKNLQYLEIEKKYLSFGKLVVELTEELNILKSATGTKGLLLTKEIGLTDTAAKDAYNSSCHGTAMTKKLEKIGADDNSSITSDESRLSRMSSINFADRHMEMKPNQFCNTSDKERSRSSDTSSVSGFGFTPEHSKVTRNKIQESGTTLANSIHAPKADQSRALMEFHVGILCSAFNGSIAELYDYVKATLIKNGINYLKIFNTFYNGNGYMMVSLTSKDDVTKVLDIQEQHQPKFIRCQKLDRTYGKRTVIFKKVPKDLVVSDISRAVTENFGQTLNIGIEENENFNEVTCEVDLIISDYDFEQLRVIHCMNYELERSNIPHNNLRNTAKDKRERRSRKKVTCKFWANGRCNRHNCAFAHSDFNDERSKQYRNNNLSSNHGNRRFSDGSVESISNGSTINKKSSRERSQEMPLRSGDSYGHRSWNNKRSKHQSSDNRTNFSSSHNNDNARDQRSGMNRYNDLQHESEDELDSLVKIMLEQQTMMMKWINNRRAGQTKGRTAQEASQQPNNNSRDNGRHSFY